METKAESRRAGRLADLLCDGADVLATGVRHGAIALDTSDKLLVIVAVTFGDGHVDLQATDSGVVEVSHTLAARIEDHHCAHGLGRKQQRVSPIVCITLCLTIAKTVKIIQLNQ